MLDIIFLSYDETQAEQNWQNLHARFPFSQRVHGVKGVKNAHTEAARIARSQFFFIVDGDNRICEDFHFRADFEKQQDTLYVWRCLNPVNDLCYGFGGVKLYNKHILLELNKPTSIDVATTVAVKYQPQWPTASVTHFNTTPFEAWRGAFRECVKLASNVLRNPDDHASMERLQTWCSLGTEKPNGYWTIVGAQQGRHFAQSHRHDNAKLAQINDFDWLRKHFEFLNTPGSQALHSRLL